METKKPHIRFEIFVGIFLAFFGAAGAILTKNADLLFIGLLGMALLWIIDLQKTVYGEKKNE